MLPTNNLNFVVDNFYTQFNNRVLTQVNASLFTGALHIEMKGTEVVFRMVRDGLEHALSIPAPFERNGVTLIMSNGVERAVSKFFWKIQGKLMSYTDVIYEILFGYPIHILPAYMCKSTTTTMQQIKYAFERGAVSVALYNIQKKIDHIVHGLPLHETDFNSFIMNKRITIFDPNFDVMVNPEEKHAYQTAKNIEYFKYGWSSLGLSDGSLADKNYMLDFDLRKLTPFGMKFHNPQRNLYSTLGMRGDEEPLVHSETTAELAKLGLTRKGWNLFTLFVDIPDVWEDQLMVDISHTDKFIEYEKRCLCFGNVVVVEGQDITTGDILYINADKKPQIFDVQCDSATVMSIEEDYSNVGGVLCPLTIVKIAYRRYLKDGTKLTNLAANKGVIRMRDLGYAINPVTGEHQKVDVIVSSKAVLKRKNYTQVLEALLNNLNNNNPVAISEQLEPTEDSIKAGLKAIGYPEDGTWECHTYAGKFNCVAGKVFWGVTHDADDTVWRPKTTEIENGRGLRKSGLKFSTIEFRALATRFGQNNAVEKEILSYAQGFEDLKELFEVLKHRVGRGSNHKIINVKDIDPLLQERGVLITEESLKNSIVSQFTEENGFLLKLPLTYQVVLNAKYETISEGYPCEVPDEIEGVKVFKTIRFDTIYVPYHNLRGCWKHNNGSLGLNDVGTALNNIVVMSHRYLQDNTEGVNVSMVYKIVAAYFNLISGKLSTKTGDISVYGMSVRYPNSAKGVATLSNSLPPNTVEIYKDMAKELKVVDGDIVLVERFPCLGFMSLRPQQVKITDDIMCKYTVRVSGNSLGSMSLDFDGDVLYLAAFYTEEAKKALRAEFITPNKHCYEKIRYFNKKMGSPRTKEMCLSDYAIKPFEALTAQSHADIVSKLTGVKSNTGPVVALAYNLLRIMENSEFTGDQRLECGIEVFMDTVANSVFKQKHGVKSLHKVVTDAVCMADEAVLVAEGFDPEVSKIVCFQIKKKAREIGIDDLKAYHKQVQEKGGSNVINKIVKANNVLYFTSRSSLDSCVLIKNIMEHQQVDVPSKIFNKIMASEPKDVYKYKMALNSIKDVELRDCCDRLAEEVAKLFIKSPSKSLSIGK